MTSPNVASIPTEYLGEEEAFESAEEVVRLSPEGRLLLRGRQHHRAPVHAEGEEGLQLSARHPSGIGAVVVVVDRTGRLPDLPLQVFVRSRGRLLLLG